MALTRSFRETVIERAKIDPEFRAGLIEEALQAVLDGDMSEARALLRYCTHATIGFTALGEATSTPVKSLMRMLGPNGNPSADKLLAVVRALQHGSGVKARVEVAALA